MEEIVDRLDELAIFVDDLASGTLLRLLPELESPPLPVQLVVPSAQHLSPKARSFVDHAARALATLAVIRPAKSAVRRPA